jgi:hypothetical protein
MTLRDTIRPKLVVASDVHQGGPYDGEPNGDFTITQVSDPLQHLPPHLVRGYGLSAAGVVEIETNYGCIVTITP